MKVLLTWSADGEEVERVRSALPGGSHVAAPGRRPSLSLYEESHPEAVAEAADADVIMGWVLPRGILEAAARLKALIWLHAGCEELDFATLKRRGIRLANVRGANAVAVAEHAMALTLGLAKRVLPNHQAALEGRWQPLWEPELSSVLLEGGTLAVVGLGQIGAAVAKRAKAFDMRVLAVRRHPERGGAHVDAVHGPAGLHAVLGEADVVVLAAPITDETLHFIDAAALAAMKPSALLVNVARGNLVDEQALYAALIEGRLAGYASDVWWKLTYALPATHHFPTPSRTELHKLPSVLVSGNRAASPLAVKDRMLDLGIESLAAFARSEPMPRGVDLDLGY